MVAERSVTPLPGAQARRLPVVLQLPTRDGGPSRIRLRVREDRSLSMLRERALDVLGRRSLDAYMSVDGRRVVSEDTCIGNIVQLESCIALHPQLRGGAPGNDGNDHSGDQPSQLPTPREPQRVLGDPRDRERAAAHGLLASQLAGAAKRVA